MASRLRTLALTILRPPGFGPAPARVTPESRFTGQALARHKREGLELAVRARIIAMAGIAVMVVVVVPWLGVLYYEVLVGLFALAGLAAAGAQQVRGIAEPVPVWSMA